MVTDTEHNKYNEKSWEKIDKLTNTKIMINKISM